MDKFRAGDVVRSRHGWDAVVSGYDGEKVLLYNVDTRWGRTSDYPYNPEDFTLVSQAEPVTAELVAFDTPTLLDQFAMAALTGLLANPVEVPGLKSVEDVQKRYAELSFGYAQAMMKAREVQK